jgi:outer membrane protein OmpA-like peptidoglycan-associated protein
LATIPFTKVTITGYVQRSKNSKNDKSLSKSRAEAVAKVLTKAGIKKKLITTIAGGVGGKSKKSRSAVLILT